MHAIEYRTIELQCRSRGRCGKGKIKAKGQGNMDLLPRSKNLMNCCTQVRFYKTYICSPFHSEEAQEERIKRCLGNLTQEKVIKTHVECYALQDS